MLLQLQQSLTREWGEGFISTLPKDFVQNLLMEVWFLGNHPHPHQSYSSTKLIWILFKFSSSVCFNLLKNIYHLYFLGFNPDRTSKSPRREGCQTETRRLRKNQNCHCWMQYSFSYRHPRGSFWYYGSREYFPNHHP